MSDYHPNTNVGSIAKQKVIDAEHLKQTITDLCEDWHCLLLDKDILLSIIDMEPDADRCIPLTGSRPEECEEEKDG